MILTKRELQARGLLREVPAGRLPPKVAAYKPKSVYVNYDEDGDVSMTADHVIDDPREPVITPIGLLDANGDELLRVIMPVKVKMGFHTANTNKVEDTVEFRISEANLQSSDVGIGQGYVELAEVEAQEAAEAVDEEAMRAELEKQIEAAEATGKAIRLSALITQMNEQGISVIDDMSGFDES